LGNALFHRVIKLSGLPPKMMQKELTAILKKIGIKPQKLTETTLRKAAAAYLREIIKQIAR